MALAKQTYNASSRGDARYDINGLTKGERGWTDGTYWYDDNGLSLDRPNSFVQGLKGSDEMNAEGRGGGAGGYGIPGAGIYGQAVAAAKQRYQQRVADLNKQRQSLFRQSGFLGDISDDGLVSNLRTDPYNQYGAYQMLNRAQAQRRFQAEEENIGRGISSRGGLGAQLIEDMRFNFGQEDAQFGAGMTDALGAFTRTQQDYKYEYDAALWQAQLEALRMAIENGDFYPGGGGGDDGYSGSQTSLAQTARQALGIPARTVPKKPAVKKPAASFGGGLGAALINKKK